MAIGCVIALLLIAYVIRKLVRANRQVNAMLAEIDAMPSSTDINIDEMPLDSDVVAFELSQGTNSSSLPTRDVEMA